MPNPFVIRNVVSITRDHWAANDASCFEQGGSVTAGLQGITPISSVLISLSEALSQIRYFMTVRNGVLDTHDYMLLSNVELALQMAVLEEGWSN